MKRQAVPSVSSSYLNIRSPRNQEKLQRQKSTEKRTESLIMACHNAKYRFYRRQSTAELSQFAFDDEKPSMPMLWVHDCSSEVIELLRSLVVERQASYPSTQNTGSRFRLSIVIDLHAHKYDVWLGICWRRANSLEPLDQYRLKLISNEEIHVGVDAVKNVLASAYKQQRVTGFRLTKQVILDLAEAAMR